MGCINSIRLVKIFLIAILVYSFASDYQILGAQNIIVFPSIKHTIEYESDYKTTYINPKDDNECYNLVLAHVPGHDTDVTHQRFGVFKTNQNPDNNDSPLEIIEIYNFKEPSDISTEDFRTAIANYLFDGVKKNSADGIILSYDKTYNYKKSMQIENGKSQLTSTDVDLRLTGDSKIDGWDIWWCDDLIVSYKS